jgi:IMP dehydrogenase
MGQGTPPSKAQAERHVHENADTTRSFSKPSTAKVAQGVSGNMGGVKDFLPFSPVRLQHSLQDLGLRKVQGPQAGVNTGRVRFELHTESAQVVGGVRGQGDTVVPNGHPWAESHPQPQSFFGQQPV